MRKKFCFFLLLFFFFFHLHIAWRDTKYHLKFELPFELREAGLWLKTHHKNPTVVSRKQWEAYYAEGKAVPLPHCSLEEMVKYAKGKNVDYIVILERYIHLRPQIQMLLDHPAAHHPFLRPIYISEKLKKVVIYKLE